MPAGRGAAVLVEAAVLERPLARFLGELVDADPVNVSPVNDEPHRRSDMGQEIAGLVVVDHRVVHVVDVEPQLVLDPLAGKDVEAVAVRHELVINGRLLLEREGLRRRGTARNPVKRARGDRRLVASLMHDVDATFRWPRRRRVAAG